jgi:multidrug resistance efflux pump
LFQAVEKMVTRVAQLKSQIRETHIKATEMEAWIKKVEAQARAVAPPSDVPTPLAITQFAQEFQEADAAIQKARAKRELAEAFWKDVVISKFKPLVHSELPYNVQKLHLQSKHKKGPQAVELCDVPSFGPPAEEVSSR